MKFCIKTDQYLLPEVKLIPIEGKYDIILLINSGKIRFIPDLIPLLK